MSSKKLLIIISVIIAAFFGIYILSYFIPAPHENTSVGGMNITSINAVDNLKEKSVLGIVSKDISIIDARIEILNTASCDNLEYKIKTYIESGTFTVKLYDTTGNEWNEDEWNGSAEGWYLNAADYPVVLSKEYSETGEYTIDLSGLEDGHTYYLAFYCSDDALFIYRGYFEWQNSLYRYIYNKFYAKSHNGDLKYQPLKGY